ncbi:MAG: thiamine pyrophosphate-dependent enzyme, partial [Thermoplasmatales archaeon]
SGSYLIEATTYRIGPHSTSDDPKKYRVDEITDGSEKDPITRLENLLLGMGVVDQDFIKRTREEAKTEVDSILEQRVLIPPVDPKSMFDDVYEKPYWMQMDERREIE